MNVSGWIGTGPGAAVGRRSLQIRELTALEGSHLIGELFRRRERFLPPPHRLPRPCSLPPPPKTPSCAPPFCAEAEAARRSCTETQAIFCGELVFADTRRSRWACSLLTGCRSRCSTVRCAARTTPQVRRAAGHEAERGQLFHALFEVAPLREQRLGVPLTGTWVPVLRGVESDVLWPRKWRKAKHPR